MAVSRTLGTLSPIVYFVNSSGGDRDPAHPPGYVMLAPYSDFPTPHGYLREYAGTLPECRALDKRMFEQSREEWEREAEADHNLMKERRKAQRDKLTALMHRSTTSEYDKEFIRLWLQLQDEKADKHAQRFMERNAYIYALENDLGDRRADSEEFHPDRINVRT